MLKVILIDDEEFTLNKIVKNVHWDKYGFELVGAFSNPFDAMQYIKDHQLDLIITDIEMPLLNGIEIAQYVSENFPNTKIVFLTAYSEFKYAKAAIEYHVVSYILKPIDFKTIEETLLKIKNESFGASIETISKFNNIKNAVIGYMNGKSDFSAVENTVYEVTPDIHVSFQTPCAIVRFTIVNLTDYLNRTWKHGLDRLYMAFHNIIQQNNYTKLKLVAFPLINDYDKINFWVVSSDNNMNSFSKDIFTFRTYFTKSCYELLNLKLDSEILKIGKIAFVLSNTETLVKNFSVKLLDYAKSYNIQAVLNTLLQYEKLTQHSLEHLNRLAVNIFLTAPTLQEKFDLPVLLNCQSYDELKALLTDMLNSLMNLENEEINSNDIINYVLIYIQNNYTHEISLQEVADEVHLSSAYFGQLFKKRVGKNFVDYLNETRINEAKKLLKTTFYKINEVSSMVGYKSYAYFLKNFIKYVGVSPSEFKNTL